MSDLIQTIKKSAEALQGELVEIRRDLHRHPELAWCEVWTTDTIAAFLIRNDVEIKRRGFNGTQSGLVAEVKGLAPGNGGIFALRADIDALGLSEETGVDYSSEVDDVCHACGHDAHAAMLMGAAKLVSENRSLFSGTVRFLFQPAEEGGSPSGASALIAEDVLDSVDAIFGMHIQATLPSGVFSYGYGPRMTASGKWRLMINGKGSHGAFPDWSHDPILAASNFVMNVQAAISREKRPLDAAVVSVGVFQPSSAAFNSIPDRVELAGTTRAYRREVEAQIVESMARIADFCAKTHSCSADFSFERGLPPLVNDTNITTLARDTAHALFGESALLEEDPQMGSEDFSYYLAQVPGSYCFLGCGGTDGLSPYAHHSPKFRIDESVLWMGAAQHAATALGYLCKK